MIYLYARVSTDKQENGREAQTQRLVDWANKHDMADHALLVDEDVSAFSIPLSQRPAGKKLWDALQPGDTVIMTKIDRGFRSWADAANTHAKWRELGVGLRFVDLDIDLTTPQGELFFSQIVAFSQYESRMHGQRKREVYAHKRQTGQPYSSTRPFGWRSTKGSDGKLSGWSPLPDEQELGRKVLAMRQEGMPWSRIALAICRAGARKPVTRKPGAAGWYLTNDVRGLARAAEAGYPRLPQAFWQAPDFSQKLRAMKDHGLPL